MEEFETFNHNKYRGKAGIYRFYNIKNGKSYVGQSIDLGTRLYAHIRHIRSGKAEQVIYKAFRKYGVESFYIEILTILPKDENLKKNLDLCEKIYINYYDSYNNGYNSTLGGDGGILGYHMTEEEKHKRSLAQKGIKKDPLKINPKAKTVYMYNISTETYIMAASTMDAEEIANARGYSITCGNIQDCARGYHKTTRGFICSYNLEELKRKISILYNNGN